ncbi:transposable element Tcb2 transposase [Scomber scombrus]|uniref:Transposable element Tcb2 transposase n=1 Tax=Scomber scombrus TaxID=13677 RepID=A0AAV1MSB9_SCOSC
MEERHHWWCWMETLTPLCIGTSWRTIASHMQDGSMGTTFVCRTTTLDHRAAAVREYLDAEGVQQMPWPAYSPDMNPSEHAGDAVGRSINERNNIPQTLQDLAQALTEGWDALPTDNINKLVDSMP